MTFVRQSYILSKMSRIKIVSEDVDVDVDDGGGGGEMRWMRLG